MYNKNYKKRTF